MFATDQPTDLKNPRKVSISPTQMGSRNFQIRVPATSANIGPGFDVVGLSLSLYLNLSVSYPLDPPQSTYVQPQLSYSGEGAHEVPLDAYRNLTTRVALYVMRCHNISRFPSHFALHVDNEIPFGRGLGSSGAAVIAGVLLGNEVGQLNLSSDRLLDFALMVERHPDNVTAALVGGFVGSYLKELDKDASEAASVPLSEVLPEYPPDADENWGLNPPLPPYGIGHYIRFPWSESIKALAIIPRFELSTAKARDVLPQHYSRKDLVREKNFCTLSHGFSFFLFLQVFNLQRLAVLTTALGQTPPNPELIYEAMKDRVHQPYRKSLVRTSSVFFRHL
jgi:homoserine kinase